MINYFKWYNNFFPLNIQPGDKCVQLLNTGFVYIFGRDHQFRPVIICQPGILQKNLDNYSVPDILNASIFICQYMANYMLIPGQIENWIMIINMEGTSLLSLPDGLKEVIKALSEYFIARLYRCYILGLNIILRALYKLVCAFLERTTIEKVIILDNKEDPRKNQDINPENIEHRFGGEAPDLIYEKGDCLFPPRMPNNNFFLETENPKEILITEEEYIEKYNSGYLPTNSVSPYILEKLRKEKNNKEKEEITRKKREEAQLKRDEAKTRAEINIYTTWISSNEQFDLSKFKTKSNKFMDRINTFKQKRDKFCNGITELIDPESSDDGNFE